MWVRLPPALPYIRGLLLRTPPYMAVKEHAKCRHSSLSGAVLVQITEIFQNKLTQSIFTTPTCRHRDNNIHD